MLWGARTSGYCQNTGAGPSHWRDRHFDDTPCLSRLKHLIQVQGGCHQMTVSPTASGAGAAVAGAGAGAAALVDLQHREEKQRGSENTLLWNTKPRHSFGLTGRLGTSPGRGGCHRDQARVSLQLH